MSRFERSSTLRMSLLAFLLTAFVAGCGSGSGGPDQILGTGGAGALDTTRPTVTSTVPAAGATGVALNTSVTASFSEPMDPSTITTGTFTLACPAGTAIAGTVSYASSGNTATFDPASNLPASTTCTATITTGARDTAGNALASNFVWTFTTGAAADTTPPIITSRNPANGATGVCLQKRINATFNEAMDPSTITTATFTVQNPDLSFVGGTVSYNATTVRRHVCSNKQSDSQ